MTALPPSTAADLITRIESGPVYLTHKEAYDLAILWGSDTALGLASVIRKAFAGGSIDAALALAMRVLDGWCWEIRFDKTGAVVSGAINWWNEGLEAVDQGGVHSKASTPALALVSAILKAKGAGG